MKQHFDRKAWKFDKDKKPSTGDRDEVNLRRRGILRAAVGVGVAAGVTGGATARYLASKLERKNNTPTLQKAHKAWHEKTLAELEKGNGALFESIKQQIARHLMAQDWCHSQIRTLENQLPLADNEATTELAQENIYNYRSQIDFLTSEIQRLSKPILEHHKKHILPLPEGIPLPDETMPGMEHTSV